MKRWEAIRLALVKDLRAGIFLPGDRLPGDLELANRFGVNRHTVRQSIKAMEFEGMLRVQHGVGTFVADDFISHELGRDPRFSDSPAYRSRLIRRDLLSARVVAAEPEIALVLEMNPLDQVTQIMTLSFVDTLPLSYNIAYYPAARVPGLATAFEGSNSPTAALLRCGVASYERKWTRIGARRALREEGERLEIPMGSPVLTDSNLDIDSNGRPIKFAENVIRSDRFEFSVNVDPSNGVK